MLVQAQAGWLQHDFGHHTVFNSTRLNHFFHDITIGFLKVHMCMCVCVGEWVGVRGGGTSITIGFLKVHTSPNKHFQLLGMHTHTHMQGVSSYWWNYRHFQHHAKPNVVSGADMLLVCMRRH